MSRRLWTIGIISLLLSPITIQSVMAEAWVDKLCSVRKYNFGAVARGSDTVYRFEIRNIYKQDIHLIGVRTSCGCTSPTIENKTLKTGEVGYLVAKFNTRTFTGIHGATLTLQVEWDDHGRRRRGETQFRVDGDIRGDVVFQPGAVKFDSIDQGATPEKKIRVSYSGRSGWKISDVRSVSEDFEVELVHTEQRSGRVSYDLLVRMKENASTGYFKQQLILVTNDSRHPRIPLDVEGRVIPEISVAPETLVLGDVRSGEPVSKKILVRGKKPFRILSVDCDEGCFHFETDNEAKMRHVVLISFDANRDAGPVKETIHITTDLGPEYGAILTAYATVLPSKVETKLEKVAKQVVSE